MKPTANQGQCYHCGEPLPPVEPLQVTIDGTDRPVCCRGCQAVAAMLVGADMTAFYQQRTGFAPSPEKVDQTVADWFHDQAWVDTFVRYTEAGQELPLLVSGMSCAACTWVIEKFLRAVPTVRDVDINLSLARVVITLEADADPAQAIGELLKLGYGVRPWRTDERLEQMRADSKRDMRRLGVAGLGMMQVGMFAIALHAGDMQGIDADMQQLLRGFSAPLALFVLVYSGRSFFHNAWQHLKKGALVMDSSVSLALLLATGASVWATITGVGETYYDSVSMFIFFLLLARFVEKRLRDADLIALVHIEDTLPEFVNCLNQGHWQRTPRDQVDAGATIRVAAGEAIAFDGHVLSGQSAVEESVFTGESLPRTVTAGDDVFAGTVNREASIDICVCNHYRDSRLATLAQDVERARREKPPYLRLIDRLAARFVAFVLLAAAFTAVAWWWVAPERALWASLAVLVVACPCALSLATPAAMASATAWLRGRGISVHGEFGLLAAADARQVLIDKTGTLTDTCLVLDNWLLSDIATRAELESLAASLQQFSHHPAARAFHHLDTHAAVSDVEVVAGAGVEARWSRLGPTSDVPLKVRLGSDSFCREWIPTMPEAPDSQHYWVALVTEHQWLAWIGLAETLRPGAQEAIARLKALDLKIQMLSGDQESRVQIIAAALGIGFRAGLQPNDKLRLLQDFQQSGTRVIAIGDGLNDAPLLGAADASIAVAGAAALARAQADFAVSAEDLTDLPRIISAARQARRVMRENLFWAAFYNIVGIPFAALGFVPPWLAAIGMSLSSLLVVLNALRLRRMTV